MSRANLIIALAIALVALGYLNFDIYSSAIDTSSLYSPVDEAAPSPQLTADNPQMLPAAKRLSDFTQTITRPIFTNDRHPIERKAKVANAGASKVAAVADVTPKQLQLVGVIQGEKAQALIRSSAGTQGTWMSIGEDIDGWRLREVADNMAVIETGGRRYQLFLYAGSGAN
jgi:hypothetical protein